MKRLSLVAALALAACGAGVGGDPPRADDARALHQRGILTVQPHPPSRPMNTRGRG